jgi:hypothetical protein
MKTEKESKDQSEDKRLSESRSVLVKARRFQIMGCMGQRENVRKKERESYRQTNKYERRTNQISRLKFGNILVFFFVGNSEGDQGIVKNSETSRLDAIVNTVEFRALQGSEIGHELSV